MAVLSGCTTAPSVDAPSTATGQQAQLTYTVVRGDTLYSIAFRYDLDYQQLAEWNQLKSADLIYVGQTLLLSPPGSAALPVVAAVAPSATVRPIFANPPKPPLKPSVPVRGSNGRVPEPVPVPVPVPVHEPEPVQVAVVTPPVRPTPEPVAAPVAAVPPPVAVAVPTPPPAPVPVPVVAPVPDPVPVTTAKARTASGLNWVWPTDGSVVRSYQPDVPGRKGIQIGGKRDQSIRAAAAGQVVYSGSGLPGYGRLIIVKHSNSLLSAYGYLGEIYVKEGDKVKQGQNIAKIGTSTDNRPVLHFEIRQNGKPVNPMNFLPS